MERNLKSGILQMLLKKENYLSGQKICEEWKVSRTAVWKAVNQLKEEGYVIDSVNNKGYHLVSCPDLVTSEAIVSRIQTKWLGKNVIYKEETDSTNNEAKRAAEEGGGHGTVITAETQSRGKGRRGRTWESKKGDGVFMSILLKPSIEPVHASMLTLVAGLAVTKAIRARGLEAMIKWPNDIVIHGKKVCGILTEMSSELDFIHYVVIGIGVNVNQEYFSEEIREKAASLFTECQKKLNRSVLICDILEEFEKYYEVFERTESLRDFMDEYNSRLVSKDKMVRVEGKEENKTGLSRGINEKGELLVEISGKIMSVTSGEVSVRGLYGYV